MVKVGVCSTEDFNLLPTAGSSEWMKSALTPLAASNPDCYRCLMDCDSHDSCSQKCQDGQDQTCVACPPGSASKGAASECTVCQPGTMHYLLMPQWIHRRECLHVQASSRAGRGSMNVSAATT